MSVSAGGHPTVAKRRDRNVIMTDSRQDSAEPEPDGMERYPSGSAQLTDAHAAASRPPDPAAGAKGSGSGYLRGRPRGRLRATTTPPMNS